MPLINLYKISPHSVYGIWKIEESIEQMTEISITEKIYLNNKMNNKKFKETVASRMVIKSLCPLLKLNYFGTHNNNSGKPFLIKNNVNISISHSYPYAVGLINKKKECGIDIEKISKRVLKINPKFLNKYESN